jgi:putative Mg2+ transporter-C (MgtC) family protein
MSPFTASFWAAVGVAAACGFLIGVERQIRGKPAGIRTSILICLGTTVFVRLGLEAGVASGTDPTRVLAQVVTGVGFIGAGVMLAREGLVRGVTSAAVIWMLAAIGSMVGLRHYAAAIVTAVIVLAVLTSVQFLERGVLHLRRGDYAAEALEEPSQEESE